MYLVLPLGAVPETEDAAREAENGPAQKIIMQKTKYDTDL